MKKIVFFLMLALALGFASCERTPKGSASLKDVDLVVYDQGHLKLYQSTTNTLSDFKAETDSVINAVFGPDNKLYYTVAKSDNLTLKCIDLNEEKPEPKICAGWNLKLGHCQEYYSGDVSELFLIDQGRKVAILCGEDEEENYGFLHAATYDIASGKLGMLSDDEFFDTEFYVNKIDDKGPYEMSDGQIYFYDASGRHCLSDQLDFTDVFGTGDDWERSDLEYEAISTGPLGNLLLFSAIMPWGDYGFGPFCVSTLDGSRQTVLKGTYISDTEPGWLKNGSLAFLETVGEDYKPSRVNLMDVDGNITTLCNGNGFTVRLLDLDAFIEKEVRKAQAIHSVANSELALFSKGHLSFYNAVDKKFYELEKETDSVTTGVFSNDGKFYYCVDKEGELFLKCVDLNDDQLEPVLLTDWGIKTDSCVSETYGEFAPFYYFPSKKKLMVYYNFVWDYFGFKDAKLYHIYSHQVTDYHWDEDNDIWEDKMYYDDYSPYAFSSESEQFYYDNFGEHVCLSDQLDPKALVSDPDYAIGLEYYEGSVSPKGDMVLFMAPIEAGDFEHGPYCVASLDGKFQTMFPETDFCQNEAVWLSDGSLVFQSADENTGCIKILYPDHKTDILSYATMFVKRE